MTTTTKLDLARIKLELREMAGALKQDGGDLRLRARYTRLCALVAARRGRRHLSPRTRPERGRWLLGIEALADWDASVPGCWRYRALTPEIERAWAEGIAADYAPLSQ